ncbi:1-phosphatidylinositol 4,5-bisphosphate phosphodiesterase beta-2 [Triplophysa tibetana]|uniref:Phosphoinositide phospholipase C n=1 Tax=Triplophysa tibetana TaxID=1572043 RepID=A0A5A9NRY0_9TELE|nr:1-phosphatidylinositol 4,5-bisphosphate phosphodiesterase beta-2 [Triplophysa tibetana]
MMRLRTQDDVEPSGAFQHPAQLSFPEDALMGWRSGTKRPVTSSPDDHTFTVRLRVPQKSFSLARHHDFRIKALDLNIVSKMSKNRYSLKEPDVKEYLVKGDRFTKWKEDSKKTIPVTLKMDPKGFYLVWTNQSKETELLDVATIRDTRAGKYAKVPKHQKVRNVFNMDFPDSHHLAKTLTIVTGADTVNLTYLNFFAAKEVAQQWADDILAIAYNTMRANACRQIFLEKLYVRLTLQTNKDGKIPVKTCGCLCGFVCVCFDTIKLDVFTEAAFKTFVMHLCPRPEINEIFTSFTKGKGFMTKEMLAKFLNEKQRDPRLNQELFPPVRPDQMKTLIEKYEPSSSNASRGQISPEGLMFYLMGSETSVVHLDKLAQSHDMTQPIGHYFVKSSHNTYLTAGQLTGVSSPEMYRQCLLSGCRCLELDCWKGKPPDEEPIITHGFTMTTEILFKDVIEAINESAFKTSQYPIVLSFENHVDTVKQQEKMAHHCRTIFGDKLLVDPLDKYPLKPGQPIPSPSELMYGHDDHEEHDDHDEQDEEKMKNSDEGTAGQEVTAFEEMSAIVNYVQPNKFVSFENAIKKNRSYVISSFVETKGESLIAKNAVDWVDDDCRYNKRQMSRIYPKGTRVDSSNYSPQPFWTAGCQFVALNYQTMDFPMQLNMALFEFNGRTGYLLKHEMLRKSDKKFDPFTERFDTIIACTLSIKIYSGQFLSDKSVKTGVEVELIGLPKDPKKKFRTKWTATPNAINPEWNEEPFVFEKILLQEMAYLRIVVHEESGKFIGHRILPLDALQTDFTDALFNPVKTTKPPKQESATYVSEYELPVADGAATAAIPADQEPAPETKPEENPEAASETEPKAEEPPADPSDPPTVTCEELQQHKNFLKVSKKQEKDLKDMEKKFQKKRDDVTQKYGKQMEVLKKKSSVKKSEGSEPTEQITDIKQKLQTDLRAVLVEHYDQTKNKKEQQNTELNKDAVSEHSKNMWSLPNELTEAVNSCVKPHYPNHVEKAEENRTEPANETRSSLFIMCDVMLTLSTPAMCRSSPFLQNTRQLLTSCGPSRISPLHIIL